MLLSNCRATSGGYSREEMILLSQEAQLCYRFLYDCVREARLSSDKIVHMESFWEFYLWSTELIGNEKAKIKHVVNTK